MGVLRALEREGCVVGCATLHRTVYSRNPGKLHICLRHQIQNMSVYQQPRLAMLKLTEQDNTNLICDLQVVFLYLINFLFFFLISSCRLSNSFDSKSATLRPGKLH